MNAVKIIFAVIGGLLLLSIGSVTLLGALGEEMPETEASESAR
jgi:hypothetical protein